MTPDEQKAWRQARESAENFPPYVTDVLVPLEVFDAADAELATLRARIDDVEGMAKVLYEQMNPGLNYDWSSIKGMWTAQARAVSRWLKEGK
jgi:hypothetical protein